MPASDQKTTRERYMLIPRTLIFLTRGDLVLLLKGAPDKRLWANRFNGIGGHVEAGEGLLSAARRELREETGLNPEELYLCGTIVIDTGENPGIGIFVYRGECTTPDFTESAEGSLRWVPRHQVFDLPLVDDLHTLLPRVFAHQKGNPPFSAHYRYTTTGELVIDFGE